MLNKMHKQLLKDLDRIDNHSAVSIGKAFPIVYRAVKEQGSAMDAPSLIKRLQNFEAKVGYIQKAHIPKIIQIIIEDKNNNKGKTI